MIGNRSRRRETRRPGRARAIRPALQALEGRLLLYATTGAQWVKPARITYSFVPDGTDIGGAASNLQATFNARFGSDAWKTEFHKAAAAWQRMAKINFDPVADDGSPIGVSGSQQGDSRFGDIRIGGFAQPATQLAFAYLPPPTNGGTPAGDMFFNTAQAWRIDGTTYDVMTVAMHEFGHSLGMHHSTDAAAVMWPAYTGTKRDVTTDDTGGIRQVYNARQNDFFDANGANNSYSAADGISAYLNAAGQLTLSALDSTTPMMIASGDNDWMKVVVPPTTTGTMVVKMQSRSLSLLSPYIAVYNATATTRLAQQSSLAYGDTVSVTISGVTAGQTYLILAKGATTGLSGFGSYALQVNFGSTPLPPVALPSTTLAQTADQGGGGTLAATVGNLAGGATTDTTSQAGDPGHFWVYDEWGGGEVLEEVSATLDTTPSNPEQASESIKVGKLVGRGHVMTIAGVAGHDEAHEGSGQIIDLTPPRGRHPRPGSARGARRSPPGRPEEVEIRLPDAPPRRPGAGGDEHLLSFATPRRRRGRPAGPAISRILGRGRPAAPAMERTLDGWRPGGL